MTDPHIRTNSVQELKRKQDQENAALFQEPDQACYQPQDPATDSTLEKPTGLTSVTDDVAGREQCVETVEWALAGSGSGSGSPPLKGGRCLTADVLQGDLLHCILACLPARLLASARRVSRQWRVEVNRLVTKLRSRAPPGVVDVTVADLLRFPALTALKLDSSHLPCQVPLSIGEPLSACRCLPPITHLDLTSNTQITAKSLRLLPDLPTITSLTLRGCSAITEQALVPIASLTKLTALDLAECRHLDSLGDPDAALVPVELTGLTSLDMSYCPRATSRTVARLEVRGGGLRTLRLAGCPRLQLDPRSLRALTRLSALTTLDLSDLAMQPRHLSTLLTALPALTHLDASGGYVSHEFPAVKAPVAGLQTLRLSNWVWDEVQFPHTAGRMADLFSLLQPTLASLDLSFTQGMTRELLAAVGLLTALQSLDLSNCFPEIQDCELAHLDPCRSLTALDLSHSSAITDLGVSHLAQMHDAKHQTQPLASLNLTWCKQVNGSCLKVVGLFLGRSLTSLDLAGCDRVFDSGIKTLPDLKVLTYLDLTGCCDMTDKAFMTLPPAMTQLTSLKINYCSQLTDRSLHALAPLVQLAWLEVSGCKRMTEAGIMALEPLVLAGALSRLDAYACPHISRHCLETLQGRAPSFLKV